MKRECQILTPEEMIKNQLSAFASLQETI